MLTVFWDMKGSITIDFLEKGPSINNATNYQLLNQNSPYLLNDPYTKLQFFIKLEHTINGL